MLKFFLKHRWKTFSSLTMATTTKTDAQCEAAIKEFVEITGVDEAMAHAILQDLDFELEEAVFRFYSEVDAGPLPESIVREVEEAGLAPDTPRPEVTTRTQNAKRQLELSTNVVKSEIKDQQEADIDDGLSPTKVLKKDEEDALIAHQDDEAQDEESNPETSVEYQKEDDLTPKTELDQPGPSIIAPEPENDAQIPKDFTIISYNIDGLDDVALQKRFLGVLHIVAKVNPDVIFFQEVVKAIEPKIYQVLSKMYDIFTGFCGVPYYTVTCVAKCIKVESHEIVNYLPTQMGRNMLCVEGKWQGLNVRLINSHLESCWDQASARKIQFRTAMEKLKTYCSQPDTLSIFAGDLNIRDAEVSNVPNGVQDLWIATGSNPAFKFTWDTVLNDNKVLSNDNNGKQRHSRNRFDRFYAAKGPYRNVNFYLEGKQRIAGCGRFPSDHFAIVAKFSAPKLE